jgi:hypothetical protein
MLAIIYQNNSKGGFRQKLGKKKEERLPPSFNQFELSN